jgi:hypothetical protein
MFVYTEGSVTAGMVKNVIIIQVKSMYINRHFKDILHLINMICNITKTGVVICYKFNKRALVVLI